MNSVKSVTSHSKNFYCFFESFLSYLVCVQSFKPINSSSLSRKKYDGDQLSLLKENGSIVNKYTAAAFPSRFVLSIIDNFDSGKGNLIIPQLLLEERKTFTINLPFSSSNESFLKRFISKLNCFTNEKCIFNVVWNTRKVQSLFPLKDKVDHYSCVI